jgi:hypothetical protein
MAIGVRLRDFVGFVEFWLLSACLVLVAGLLLCWPFSFYKTKY